MAENSIYKNSNVDIFIYSHIPFVPIATDKTFKVLTNNNSPSYYFNTDLAIYRDYTGDNISDKNLMYNEYSGFYWIWKNYPIKDYVGMNHYRRMYRCFDDLPDVNEIFKTKKIILSTPFILVYQHNSEKVKKGQIATNYEWYKYWHCIDDLDLTGKIIQELYPEYMDGFEKMCNSEYIFNSSMFIMDKETYFKYCEFVFSILNRFNEIRGFKTSEDCIKYVTEHKDQYINKEDSGHSYYDVEKQSRIIGYLAERILATFLMHGGENSLEHNAHFLSWGMVYQEDYQSPFVKQ